MFRCEKCKRVTSPREKLHKITVLTRLKTYQNVYVFRGKTRLFETTGEEIVKEISVCERCAIKHGKN